MSAQETSTVLVVADSRLTAAMLARQLGPKSAVPSVRTGEQALERILLDESIVAVVCELALPASTGEAFLARLRGSRSARLRELPFVALGGNDDPERALALVAAGANAYVSKLRASQDLAPTLATLLPNHFDGVLPVTGHALSHSAAVDGTSVVMPIASVLRLRWTSSSVDTGPQAASQPLVDDQIRAVFEGHLRARDRWRPDGDGHGGLLGLTCPIEDSLRPLLRLASNLTEAAGRFNRSVSISMTLETVQAPGTIDFSDAQRWIDAPELPEAGEMTVVLPSAQFRLKLDRVGRS